MKLATGPPWGPFEATLDWQLSAGIGEHTVSAELRAGSQRATSSDTIYLTSAGNPPELGNLPDSLVFTYSIPDQELLPAFQLVTPLNVGNDDPLSWKVTAQGTFFTVEPLQGTTPESITITPTDFDRNNPNIYTGAVTITVVDPAGVAGSPHTITLTLQVVDTQIFQTYLPGIQN